VAIRSSTGTKPGEPSVVTLSTNSRIEVFATQSFQEGRRSAETLLEKVFIVARHKKVDRKKIGTELLLFLFRCLGTDEFTKANAKKAGWQM
jgi:hypothetical protein